MHIKKIFVMIIATLLVAGCGSKADSDKLNVMTTVFPTYDFVREIAHDEVTVELLLKPGTDFHTFDPSIKEVLSIEESDLFIYIGTEVWAEEVVGNLDKSKVKVIRLMDYIELEMELDLEGMEHDHDHEEESHDHDHEEESHDHDHEEEIDNSNMTQSELLVYDEHIWTSIKNSEILVKIIEEALISLDKENSDLYKENSDSYIKELSDLNSKMEEMISSSLLNHIVIADRFPFTYFVNDYELNASAAFSGCSSAVDASAQTIAFLIDKVEKENIKYVFYLESSSQKVSAAIADEVEVEQLELHSAHNISLEEFESGLGYIDFMNANYENLKKALN